MSTFAIIPAKSRSTRLPGKNILPIAGVPMVCRVIENLVNSQIFDQIWVSTDSEKTAELSRAMGASVLVRSKALAEDRSTVNEVCLDWLNRIDVKPDDFCCTYATAIFLTPQDFRLAKAALSEDFDGVMGVSEFNYPPVQAMKINEGGGLEMLLPEYEKVQSQYHPKCVVSNGSQYWARTDSYEKEKTFYLKRLTHYLTDESHILDINSPVDYEVAKKRAFELGW